MPNQYRPEKQTIGNILSTTNPPVIVPHWQRSYSWTTSEVDAFWQDLLAFGDTYPNDNIAGQEYFLGSIVIVDATDDHLLLDGQQRISTAAILLSVIRDYLKRYSKDAAIRTQSRYLCDVDDSTGENTYKVTMNEYDRDYYKRKILEARDQGYTEPSETLGSHRLIHKARVFLEEQFENEYRLHDTPEEAYKWTLRIQRILTKHVSVVAIYSSDEDNAAAVFETLNDRGIGLSTPDLVRNLLLGRAVSTKRDEIIDLWGEILQVEGDAPLKTFLRHYWISHYGDVKTRSLYREIKRKITSDNLDSLMLSRELRDAALVYQDILSGRSDSNNVSRLLRDAVELGATILYPVILSACQKLEVQRLQELLSSLIDAFVRYSAVGQLEHSRLENILYRMAREIRDNQSIDEMREELRRFVPNNANFREAFANVSIRRQATARYLLRKLEEDRRRTEELDVAPPSRVHVEHIYPRTPQAGQRLDNHAQVLNRIGNLTILAKRLNTAIRNSPFADKKPKYQESELRLTQELEQYEEWSATEISERQNSLAERAPLLWPITSQSGDTEGSS